MLIAADAMGVSYGRSGVASLAPSALRAPPPEGEDKIIRPLWGRTTAKRSGGGESGGHGFAASRDRSLKGWKGSRSVRARPEKIELSTVSTKPSAPRDRYPEARGARALLEPRRLEASDGRAGERLRPGPLILPDQPAALSTPVLLSFLCCKADRRQGNTRG